MSFVQANTERCEIKMQLEPHLRRSSNGPCIPKEMRYRYRKPNGVDLKARLACPPYQAVRYSDVRPQSPQESASLRNTCCLGLVTTRIRSRHGTTTRAGRARHITKRHKKKPLNFVRGIKGVSHLVANQQGFEPRYARIMLLRLSAHKT